MSMWLWPHFTIIDYYQKKPGWEIQDNWEFKRELQHHQKHELIAKKACAAVFFNWQAIEQSSSHSVKPSQEIHSAKVKL